jgi:uncharacterized protein
MRSSRFFAAIVMAAALVTVARAAEPTPSHLKAAREVVVGSGIARSFDAVARDVAQRIRQTTVLTRPELEKDLDAVLLALKPEIDARAQEMIVIAARAFAERLSEPELTDTASFFKSATGQRYVNAQPLILDQLGRSMDTWVQTASETLMTRVREEMRKRGHTL